MDYQENLHSDPVQKIARQLALLNIYGKGCSSSSSQSIDASFERFPAPVSPPTTPRSVPFRLQVPVYPPPLFQYPPPLIVRRPQWQPYVSPTSIGGMYDGGAVGPFSSSVPTVTAPAPWQSTNSNSNGNACRARGGSSIYRFCAFCKSNRETPGVYESHELRDDEDRVTCPYLRKVVCIYCGATGDKAHTASYCPDRPVGAHPLLSRGMISKRLACGRLKKT